MCTEYILYIKYMFVYFASLYDFLWHNKIEYISGYFLTLMTCTEWNQAGLYSMDSNLACCSFAIALHIFYVVK